MVVGLSDGGGDGGGTHGEGGHDAVLIGGHFGVAVLDFHVVEAGEVGRELYVSGRAHFEVEGGGVEGQLALHLVGRDFDGQCGGSSTEALGCLGLAVFDGDNDGACAYAVCAEDEAHAFAVLNIHDVGVVTYCLERNPAQLLAVEFCHDVNLAVFEFLHVEARDGSTVDVSEGKAEAWDDFAVAVGDGNLLDARLFLTVGEDDFAGRAGPDAVAVASFLTLSQLYVFVVAAEGEFDSHDFPVAEEGKGVAGV